MTLPLFYSDQCLFGTYIVDTKLLPSNAGSRDRSSNIEATYAILGAVKYGACYIETVSRSHNLGDLPGCQARFQGFDRQQLHFRGEELPWLG